MRYRYYVDEAEHQALIDATGLDVVATNRNDGAERNLNCYSVLVKRPK